MTIHLIKPDTATGQRLPLETGSGIMTRATPRWLQPDNVVPVEIDGIRQLRNPVILNN
jgi:hypothetical protein